MRTRVFVLLLAFAVGFLVACDGGGGRADGNGTSPRPEEGVATGGTHQETDEMEAAASSEPFAPDWSGSTRHGSPVPPETTPSRSLEVEASLTDPPLPVPSAGTARSARTPRAFVLCNVDDDDGDGKPDRATDGIDGNADANDLTRLDLGKWTAIPQRLVIRLAASPGARGPPDPGIRVYDAYGRIRLGRRGGTPVTSWSLPAETRSGLLEEGLSLWIEGTRFASKETLEVVSEQGVEHQLEVHVSPLQIAPSYGEPVKVLHSVHTGENQYAKDFKTQLEEALTLAGGPPVLTAPCSGSPGCDWWIQDQVQWAWTTTPRERLPVVVLLPRLGLSKPWCEALLGSGCGRVVPVVVEPASPPKTGRFFGGNLEALPPTASRAHGSAYGGFLSRGGAQDEVPAPLQRYLEARSSQVLVPFDVSLMHVGHVDEFVAFVPHSEEGNPPYLLVASPGLGAVLLDGTTEAPDDDFAYFDHENVPAGDSLLWQHFLDHVPTATNSLSLWAYNQALESRIFGADGSGGVLGAFLEQLDPDEPAPTVVRVPTFFFPVPTAEQVARGFEDEDLARAAPLVPNMVNLLSLPGHVITADPRVGCFSEQLQAALAGEPDEAAVELHLIDIFDLLHKNGGGVHCATNLLNEAPEEPNWWEEGS